MTKRIFRTIIIVAGSVLAAAFVIIIGCLYGYFIEVQENLLCDELDLAAAGAEYGGVEYLNKLDCRNYRLTWISKEGTVLFDSEAKESDMENHANREEVAEALKNGTGKSSRYSETLLKKTIYYAKRISDGSVVRISISQASVGYLALGMLQPVIVVFVFAFILSAVLAKRLSTRIVAPLNEINLENPLENETYDELSPLLYRIYKQREQINEQMQRLKQKSEEFNQIADNMSEGLVLLNDKGKILSINSAAKRLFNSEDDTLYKDFMTIERSHDINQAFLKAVSGENSEIQFEREGREYQLNVNKITSDEKVVGVVILAFDITEQANAERNRREFAANVSHELKTPLQTIMGSAELIEHGLVKPEDVSRFAGRIHSEASRLVVLIDDIIRLSQLDEGGDFHKEEVDVFEIANEVADLLKDKADLKKVTVNVDGENVKTNSVRRLLTEIIFNLCDNAIKYNVENGYVNICIEKDERNIVITVKDNGIGIPAEHQSRVFERFYRVDKSRSKETGGTGLGLSIVKHAAIFLNGKIELKSNLGEGTTVKVIIPDEKSNFLK